MSRPQLAGRLSQAFIHSKLTPLFLIAAIAMGAAAVVLLPREEEPQIIVPMIDIFVALPGASAKEVETRITRPMERLLWEIPGVEYIYSTSSPGFSMAIVRFYVGEDEEKSIVRLNQKMFANFDLIPPGASQPLIKPRSIDDVPFLALTLWSSHMDGFEIRRVAAELRNDLQKTPDISATQVIGGQRRVLMVEPNPVQMAAFGIGISQVRGILQMENREADAGNFTAGNEAIAVHLNGFLRSADDLANLVVGVHNNFPVYLRNIAQIKDGPEEPKDYVLFTPGPAAARKGIQLDIASYQPIAGLQPAVASVPGRDLNPAVTISFAKRKGKNAVVLSEEVLKRAEAFRARYFPSTLQMTVTRNYGETAAEKSNELLLHMMIAIISVTLLIWLILGFREAAVVAVAIPVTLALTLVVFLLYGYTLNRITLFALIFSIGILVDDAIVVIENVVRHKRMPQNRDRRFADVAVEAVDEVGNPTILATFTVIAAILPMAMVRGLMGPYMRPIPIGASAAMIFSLLVAFVITPWAALRFLKGAGGTHHASGEAEDWSTRFYRRFMGKLLSRTRNQWGFLALVSILLLASMSLVYFRRVIVKMLPFDNKSEFQVIIDMPEGTSLEKTAAVTRSLVLQLAQVQEITDLESYIGTASPYNFNGLVRHYYLRRGDNVADIQVNLTPKGDRSAQSHAIARRAREMLIPVAEKYGARIKVAEVPPGPPVLQTLVAEIYGPNYDRQIELAREIRDTLDKTAGVVDVDWYVEDPQPEMIFRTDRLKASLAGISLAEIQQTVQVGVSGADAGLAHLPREAEDVPVETRLPLADRMSIDALDNLRVLSSSGRLVPLSELGTWEKTVLGPSIYHKNLMPVVYVTADVGGREESPVYPILRLNDELTSKPLPEGYRLETYTSHQPADNDKLAMKWDGEWHITYEVFRDLGLAFAAVLVLIYILVVAWFQSFKTPLVIMAAIPFSLVGILPGHWAMGAFFTATSMIGFIAGAGIVVRNSIILVDFIELRLAMGEPLEQAVVDAGAVRFRPMMLTAAAVVVGSAVILFDPIFQGLAISLMAGEVASLLLSRMTVPVLFYMMRRREISRKASPAPAGLTGGQA
ncbi:MAG TPA: efflux RND transporter permease subunit [Acidobacteriota bacterium]|nr:efflux RND transporter permease subunit [Acidobacteriota bacterium]